MKKREKANFRIVNLLKPGTKIRAIYADEENDPSWYDAVINSVEVGAPRGRGQSVTRWYATRHGVLLWMGFLWGCSYSCLGGHMRVWARRS